MTPLRRSFGRLRASLAASRPPPMAAPRRGACRPPAPLGCAPCGLPATGPCCLPTSGEGASAARRPKAGGLFGCSREFFLKRWAVRMHGGGFRGACPPVQWSGGQRVGGRWAGRGQRAALSPPSTGRSVVHGGTGHRAHATHRVRREWPQSRASAQASLPTCNSNRATLQQ